MRFLAGFTPRSTPGMGLQAGIVCLLFGLVLVGRPIPTAAQELGIEYGVTDAGYGDALQRPSGVGGFLDIPIDDRFAVRLTASHHTESQGITRSPCTGLVRPGTDCSPQRFQGDASLTTFGIGMTVRLPSPIASLDPELYALATGSAVDVRFEARSGDRRLQPVTPDDPSFGVAAGGALHYAITPSIALSGRLGIHSPRFGACAEDAWVPFCDRRTMPQVAMGARIGLSELL